MSSGTWKRLALRTAASAERSNAVLPLDDTRVTDTTSPVGISSTSSSACMSLRAGGRPRPVAHDGLVDAGDVRERRIRLRIAGQLDPLAVEGVLEGRLGELLQALAAGGFLARPLGFAFLAFPFGLVHLRRRGLGGSLLRGRRRRGRLRRRRAPGRFRFRGLEDDEPGVDDVGADDEGVIVLGRPAPHEREGGARVQEEREDQGHGIVAEHRFSPTGPAGR